MTKARCWNDYGKVCCPWHSCGRPHAFGCPHTLAWPPTHLFEAFECDGVQRVHRGALGEVALLERGVRVHSLGGVGAEPGAAAAAAAHYSAVRTDKQPRGDSLPLNTRALHDPGTCMPCMAPAHAHPERAPLSKKAFPPSTYNDDEALRVCLPEASAVSRVHTSVFTEALYSLHQGNQAGSVNQAVCTRLCAPGSKHDTEEKRRR